MTKLNEKNLHTVLLQRCSYKIKQAEVLIFLPSGAETFKVNLQREGSKGMLFMLELTSETDKTLLYGSAIPFMYNI